MRRLASHRCLSNMSVNSKSAGHSLPYFGVFFERISVFPVTDRPRCLRKPDYPSKRATYCSQISPYGLPYGQPITVGVKRKGSYSVFASCCKPFYNWQTQNSDSVEKDRGRGIFYMGQRNRKQRRWISQASWYASDMLTGICHVGGPFPSKGRTPKAI